MTLDADVLAQRFEAHRGRLRAVAFRMLGSSAEADDAVQETWLRLGRTTDTNTADDIDNLGGWLTTVVSRICLDLLRSRTSRREEPIDDSPAAENGSHAPGSPGRHPEDEVVLADAVGEAMLVVLDTLSPAERLAFVLHDMFGVSFDEIAPIVDRAPAATRKLASRARQRVQAAEDVGGRVVTDRARRHEIVTAFLQASRNGEFEALLRMLDPDAVLRVDAAAAAQGSEPGVTGADAVARFLSGRAKGVRLALIDGLPGAVWAMHGTPRVVFDFTVVDGRITAIDLLGDVDVLGDLDIEYLRAVRH